MVLTGRAVSAEEALGWGLVNRVVEDGQAVAYATKLAKEVISHPYACMLADRESMYHAMDNDFDTAMLKELESFSVIPQAIAGRLGEGNRTEMGRKGEDKETLEKLLGFKFPL